MRVAVVSDEISDDFEEAVQLGGLLGVKAYKLRWLRLPGGFQRRRVGELSDGEAAALAEVANRHEVTISAISPALFGGCWGNSDELEGQMARLERALRLAEILQCSHVIVRGFVPPAGQRNDVCPPGVVEALGQAASLAWAAGLRLLLRNTPDGYADTGAHTASIVHAVHSPALGISWDPCHAVRAGESAICDGYEWVAPFVQDVRVKDQQRSDGLGYEYTVLAQGSMDWSAQFQALARDGYQGTLTLGTQSEPRLLSTMHSLEALTKLLERISDDGQVLWPM